MTLPTTAAPKPAAPRVNPLQRIWLREIGMERLWMRPAPAAARPVVVPQVPVSKPVSAPEPAPVMAAAEAAPVHVAPSVAPSTAPAPAVPVAAAGSPPAVGAAVASTRANGRPGIPASILNRTGPPPRPAPKAAEDEAAEAPRIPVAEAVKNANLDELREQVVACTACGLCDGRRHAVFGQGATPTRWLVVGEAPGEQEDRQGHPFVGRSGQLLDAMLAAVGMSRDADVFITNVIKCRPPGNRNPKPEEIAACSPYLMRQIALLKPERILVLGRFAAQTLLGTDATIGSLRGRVHSLKTDEGAEIPVIVSYHPAYLLRSPSEKARAWQDLKLASRKA
ncbi:uracil-DNA glycosylase [Achromobacter sp. UMC46]|uniref:uracil-DNA glycosylase n=1 Tax=Achromobacter sp. UMC46 TaxID=1862319 RepID=UPI001600F202|nr:uracil-DNA glycosylase [Achromobacter sp. UMC46]MBB1596005.1 uracil-DNA glycosylase [Achromobacter sp. UMC46]